MTEKQLQSTIQLLKVSKRIVIIGHKNPDGDAVGSCLGLYFFLKNRGYEVNVIMPNDYPDFLKWLPGSDEILQFERQHDAVVDTCQQADLIFTLDFNALNRTGGFGEVLESLDVPFIMIDHHPQPDEYAAVTYSDTSMSSTAEMVFHFIDYLDGLAELSPEIATNLYAGILTDTGSFRFPATSATTHQVIAQLIEAGANNSLIHQEIYDTQSPDRMKLLGVALNNMVLLPDYSAAYITLSQEELDRCQFKKGDTEGFVNYPLSIKGVVFSVIFIENKQEGIIKMSLRSKGNFSVNDFARNYFHGGGHTNAAGGRSSLSLEDTVKEFISILPSYKNALNHDS